MRRRASAISAQHGADIVVHSLTKYTGGHTDLVADGVPGSKKHVGTVRPMRTTIGTICDPTPHGC